MPEIPEVEVIARGLDRYLPGRIVQSVVVFWHRSVALPPAPAQFVRDLAGRRITHVWRQGKFVIVDLSDEAHLLVHLRMSGRLDIVPASSPLDPYVRAMFHLSGDLDLRFSDVRKFGRLYLTEDLTQIVGSLGPEPLGDDFTAERLSTMLSRRRARIKPLLLNQRFLAGLGNIYVDEALFKSGIHPLRHADSLSADKSRALHDAIQTVLKEAISRRGTTLSDYRDAEGQRGENQDHLVVYGRGEQPCVQCGLPIQRIIVGQRSTHYCPRCQPAP